MLVIEEEKVYEVKWWRYFWLVNRWGQDALVCAILRPGGLY
jgi:hypothetical protein